MTAAKGAGLEARPLQATDGAVSAVEALRTTAIDLADGASQRAGAPGDGDDVDVVRQEAMAEDGHAVLLVARNSAHPVLSCMSPFVSGRILDELPVSASVPRPPRIWFAPVSCSGGGVVVLVYDLR